MLTNLKALRTAANLTQQELADKLDVTRSAVAMWETSDNLPPSETLPRLAEILGVTIDKLFEGMSIGERIESCRKIQGLTQKELGDMVGIGTSSISEWESCERIPRLETLRKIAKALDIPASALINDVSDVAAPPAPVFTLRTLFPILNAKYVALFLHYSKSITARVDFNYDDPEQIKDILQEFGDFPIRVINFRDINNSPHVIIELERSAEGG